jgi:hypothetical protein
VAMAPKPAPDAADAVLVENAWVVMFDPRLKELLRRHYCLKRSPSSTIKALRMKRHERYGSVLFSAHNAIERELQSNPKVSALRRIFIVNQITLNAYRSPSGRVAHV